MHPDGTDRSIAEKAVEALSDNDALVIDDLWIRAHAVPDRYLLSGVSLQIVRGQCTGLLGESGSGKTLTALSILDLVPPSAGQIERGEIRYDGVSLLRMPQTQLRQLRGNRIAMVFQETQSALNPVMRIGEQLGEVLQAHRGASRKEARTAAIRALRRVHISPADAWVDAYPHELSGGMQQRVLIAMALLCGPDFLLADEPTSSLDVVLQAQMMRYLAKQRRELDIGMLLITHDIALVAEHCQQFMVMYRGGLVEKGFTQDLLQNPKHPYTLTLLRAHPDWSGEGTTEPEVALAREEEETGDWLACRFRDSCSRALSLCHERVPDWQTSPTGGQYRCWNPLPAGSGLIQIASTSARAPESDHA